MAEVHPVNTGAPAILVVEDDAQIAVLLAEPLTGEGYLVDTVGDGAAALAQLQVRPYVCIISDLRMPMLDGIGLYRVLEQDYPHLCHRIIFVTGYRLSQDIQAFVLQTGVPILWKPFDVAEICWIARLMLGVKNG